MAELRQQARELTKQETEQSENSKHQLGTKYTNICAYYGEHSHSTLYLPTHVCLHHTQYFEVVSGESHKSVGNGTHALKCHLPGQC